MRPLCLSFRSARIEPILDEALKSAVERYGKTNIHIRRAYLPGLPSLLVDPGQLRQVFENLFINALQAMGRKGGLKIETSTSPAPAVFAGKPELTGSSSSHDSPPRFNRYLVIRVGDTGPGISDEHKDKIFYPFFTTKEQGSGIGLSMAKKIIDCHHGLIDVKNRTGAGVLFSVRIPLIEANVPEKDSQDG